MLSTIEKEYVYDTYQCIFQHFDKTRHSVWKCVKKFIDSIPPSSSLLEIGCGNGKNLQYRKDLNSVGVDFVPNFVRLCKEKGLNVLEANALDLPFPDETFDFAISIAVFHHLSTEERRIRALREMKRVLKKGGRGLVVCWGIKKGDQFVEWKRTKKGNRYYHFYDENSFQEYTQKIHSVSNKISWEEGNWVFEFTSI